MHTNENRPIRTMRRHELVTMARRLGVKNTQNYNVRELRTLVGVKIARGGI